MQLQATVVEDLNYARSVRDSGGRSVGVIGIATITSIAVGIVAVLALAGLVCLALAKRRRKGAAGGGPLMGGGGEGAESLPISTSTPTQSRTTYSPVPPGTPSGIIGLHANRC